MGVWNVLLSFVYFSFNYHLTLQNHIKFYFPLSGSYKKCLAFGDSMHLWLSNNFLLQSKMAGFNFRKNISYSQQSSSTKQKMWGKTSAKLTLFNLKAILFITNCLWFQRQNVQNWQNYCCKFSPSLHCL